MIPTPNFQRPTANAQRIPIDYRRVGDAMLIFKHACGHPRAQRTPGTASLPCGIRDIPVG